MRSYSITLEKPAGVVAVDGNLKQTGIIVVPPSHFLYYDDSDLTNKFDAPVTFSFDGEDPVEGPPGLQTQRARPFTRLRCEIDLEHDADLVTLKLYVGESGERISNNRVFVAGNVDDAPVSGGTGGTGGTGTGGTSTQNVATVKREVMTFEWGLPTLEVVNLQDSGIVPGTSRRLVGVLSVEAYRLFTLGDTLRVTYKDVDNGDSITDYKLPFKAKEGFGKVWDAEIHFNPFGLLDEPTDPSLRPFLPNKGTLLETEEFFAVFAGQGYFPDLTMRNVKNYITQLGTPQVIYSIAAGSASDANSTRLVKQVQPTTPKVIEMGSAHSVYIAAARITTVPQSDDSNPLLSNWGSIRIKTTPTTLRGGF